MDTLTYLGAINKIIGGIDEWRRLCFSMVAYFLLLEVLN